MATKKTYLLIPQFTIRWLLAVTALTAAAFSVVGLAVRGQYWAIAVSVGLGAIVLTMLLYAAAFGLIWMSAQVFERVGRPRHADNRQDQQP